jgi:hypothetical protein
LATGTDAKKRRKRTVRVTSGVHFQVSRLM